METHWNGDKIVELLLKCGKNAIGHREKLGFELKEDGSLVTDIDRQNEVFLKQNLETDDCCFIGEETIRDCNEAIVRKTLQGRCWIVDPIDGTAPYAHGFLTWGISIGYLENYRHKHGAVILPDSGEILATRNDQVIYARIPSLDIPVSDIDWTVLAPPPDAWSPGGMIMLGQRYTRYGRVTLPNPVLSSGSAVQALASVICNKAQAYIGHMKIWDVAGILPMMERLGILAILDNGTPMTCNVLGGAFDLDSKSKEFWGLADTVRIARPKALETLNEIMPVEKT